MSGRPIFLWAIVYPGCTPLIQASDSGWEAWAVFFNAARQRLPVTCRTWPGDPDRIVGWEPDRGFVRGLLDTPIGASP